AAQDAVDVEDADLDVAEAALLHDPPRIGGGLHLLRPHRSPSSFPGSRRFRCFLFCGGAGMMRQPSPGCKGRRGRGGVGADPMTLSGYCVITMSAAWRFWRDTPRSTTSFVPPR